MNRAINFILAIMFMVFAFLQVNDPDPVVWILIYGAMAAVCIMAMYQVYYKSALVGLAIVYSTYCYLLFPSVRIWFQQESLGVLFEEGMKMQYPYIEESREFLGLVICLLVLLFYFFKSFRVT